mgnify:FL=1
MPNKLVYETDEMHFLSRRLVLWFSKVQFLKRPGG